MEQQLKATDNPSGYSYSYGYSADYSLSYSYDDLPAYDRMKIQEGNSFYPYIQRLKKWIKEEGHLYDDIRVVKKKKLSIVVVKSEFFANNYTVKITLYGMQKTDIYDWYYSVHFPRTDEMEMTRILVPRDYSDKDKRFRNLKAYNKDIKVTVADSGIDWRTNIYDVIADTALVSSLLELPELKVGIDLEPYATRVEDDDIAVCYTRKKGEKLVIDVKL